MAASQTDICLEKGITDCCCSHITIRPKLRMSDTPPKRRALGLLALCFLVAFGLLVTTGMTTPAARFQSVRGHDAALHRFWGKEHDVEVPEVAARTPPSVVAFARRQEDNSTFTSKSSTTLTTTPPPTTLSTLTPSVTSTTVTTSTVPETTSTTESVETTETPTPESTSSPVPQTLTSTLENGSVVAVTTTSWVNVAAPPAQTTELEPELQNRASRVEGSVAFPLFVCILAAVFAL